MVVASTTLVILDELMPKPQEKPQAACEHSNEWQHLREVVAGDQQVYRF